MFCIATRVKTIDVALVTKQPLRILTGKSSLFYSTYFFIDNIFLTYFISTSLFQFTQILHKLLYVLIIDIRCWNLYSFVYHS